MLFSVNAGTRALPASYLFINYHCTQLPFLGQRLNLIQTSKSDIFCFSNIKMFVLKVIPRYVFIDEISGDPGIISILFICEDWSQVRPFW